MTIKRFTPHTKDPADWNARYTVLMWCSWFNNLAPLAKELEEIEDRLDRNY